MPRVCDVSEVPVGGVYRDYDEQKQEPTGPEVTCLSKGVHNGIGYNVIQRTPDGREIRDMHFKYRPRVWWINDDAGGESAS
jgi:hypothetical protein